MSRSRGKWDLVFESDDRILGFQLAEPATRFESQPARLDEQARNADVPRVIDNLDAGMGYSRRLERVPNGYAYTMPGYCRAPGGIFMPSGKVTEIALPASGAWTPQWLTCSERVQVAGVDRMFLAGNGPHILLVEGDGSACSVNTTIPAPFSVGSMVVFNNRLYAAGGSGMVYLDLATGVWSAPSRAVAFSHLAVVNWRPLGVPTDVLVGVSVVGGFHAIQWCPITADPMAAASWSAPLRVGGDGRYPVSYLAAAPRHVYMLKADGVYDMDELGARAFNIAPWISEAVDYFNGGWGLHVGDGLYYSHSQGLAFVSTSGETQYRPEWAHPGWGLPYEGAVRGRVNTGTLHNGWGLAGLWSASGASESYVCAGKRTAGPAYGQATHVWHGAEAVVPSTLLHMRVYTMDWSNGWPRLLMTTGDSASPPNVRAYWQSLSKTGTPLQEMLWGDPFVPDDHASLFLPADPWDRPSSVKTLLQMDMVTERLDPGSRTLRAYAQADDETAWVDYGTAETGSYTGLAPLETTEGRYISTRVDAIGSPILRSLELRSAIGVELREARSYTVILAWDNALKGARGRETADPERRLDDLRSLLGRVCTLDDGSADGTRRVRVLQVQAGERRPMGGAARAGAAGTVGAWAITAQVMVSVLDRPFRWEGPASTDRFDADRVWT